MFITLEGIEGSGKTTQINGLAAYFEGRGMDCITTRQPGGTAIGRKIRAILLDPASREMDPLAELMLYMADRAQHLAAVIKPALAAGRTILCDRYFDATLVYQGLARGVDVALIRRLHQLVFDNLQPDLTFVLDLDPRLGLARAWQQLDNGQRTGRESRFEKEKLAFHEKVRAGYLELARREPQRFKIIDASRDENRVRKDILAVLASVWNY